MRPDITALTVGLVACLLAALGMWAAYGSVNWPLVGLLAPIALVMIGLLGLILARTSFSTTRKEQP